MASVTFAIPADVKSDMKELSWVNWSEAVKEELLDSIERQKILHKLDELFKDSELTDEDILKLSKEARKGRFKKLKSKGLA